MIFPIRPTTTETRRVDDVNVRATPAVTGITAANGFNQPGVVVTIGDGARTLARSGQQSEPGSSAQDPRLSSQASESSKGRSLGQARNPLPGGKPSQARIPAQGEDDGQAESVFATPESEAEAGVVGVFSDEQSTALAGGAEQDDPERVGVAEDEQDQTVWEPEAQNDELNPSGVPYAALQRAASVQDLDAKDVAKALAHTQIAVRVLATQEKTGTTQVTDAADAEGVLADDDAADAARLSSVPTDGVPYEALQRAVTEAENAQGLELEGAVGSPTEPIFMAPENGGAPWGREVPFEDETKQSFALERQTQPKERASEVQPQA